MGIVSTSDALFTAAANEINTLYSNDRMEEAMEKAHALLKDVALPRYHEMKTLVLLGAMAPWYKAQECQIKAETLYQLARCEHAVGEDPHVDEALEEIHGTLDQLHALRKEDLKETSDISLHAFEATKFSFTMPC